jgi:hypothetical protein
MNTADRGHTIRAMRAVALVALLSTLVLVAAGCGGSKAGAADESAATLLKPGALVYWETVSDPDSDQWSQVEELLKRFPDGDKWIAQLRKEFEQEVKVTWPEVREALGSRTVVAVYTASAKTEPAVVALTNPADTDKTIDVIRKLNEASDPDDKVVSRVVDDWVVISDKETSIDAALVAEGERALAKEEQFASGLNGLPEDSLSRVYVDVPKVVESFAPQLGEEEREAFGMLGLDEIDFAGAWASAEDKGAKAAAVVKGSSLERLFGSNEPLSSKLLDRVPEDAFAFLSFRGEAVTKQFEQLKDNPLYQMGSRQLEQELGLTIDELLRLFEGEVAFYARPAAPIPELTLLLDAADPAQARQSADRVLRAVARRSGGEVTEEGAVTTARFDGFTVSLGEAKGLVVLSTSRRAIADLEASGGKLPDSERFKDATGAAGLPDSYTGLVYVDLREAVKVITGFVDTSGTALPPEVSRNLEPLRSFVGYGTGETDSASFRAFLEID